MDGEGVVTEKESSRIFCTSQICSSAVCSSSRSSSLHRGGQEIITPANESACALKRLYGYHHREATHVDDHTGVGSSRLRPQRPRSRQLCSASDFDIDDAETLISAGAVERHDPGCEEDELGSAHYGGQCPKGGMKAERCEWASGGVRQGSCVSRAPRGSEIRATALQLAVPHAWRRSSMAS